MKKLFAVLAALFLLTIIACSSSSSDDNSSSGTHTTAVVVGGTPVNSAPPVTTTGTGTPVISNLVLNPNPAQAGDRLTFSIAFTDSGADVKTFGIQFNGENKYYAYDVSGVAAGNMAFNLTVQDTVGNVQTGSYQVVIFVIDALGNVSNYLTTTLVVQGSDNGSTTYSISGTVNGDITSGVTITLSGASSASTNTGSGGSYSFAGLSNGTYTIAPTKTGYTFSPINRSVTVSNANITGQNFTATAAGGGGAFTQADLTGTWNYTSFQTSSVSPGWSRGSLSINSSGALSFTSYENTWGGSGPGDGAYIFTINSSGIITESGLAIDKEAHCSMSTDKKTIVCAVSNGTEYATRIFVKTTGVTFSNADLTGPLSVNTHGIYAGGSSAADREWYYEAGTINTSRQYTVTEYNTPAGSQAVTPGNLSSVASVGADGFVTSANTATTGWKGMLSSDKKMMIATSRNGGSRYSLSIMTIADETFSGTSDLAGNWKIFGLWGGNGFGWMFATAAINSSGVASMTSYLNSYGDTALPSMGTLALNSSGILTALGIGTTFHGALSHDRIVSVVTESTGNYELDILMR